MSRFRYEYGAGPLHLLASIAAFAFAGYGLLRIFQEIEPLKFVLWFGGAIVAHDLILFPFYTAFSLAAYGVARGGLFEWPEIAALNHVRVPSVLSALLLLVWFPLILRLNEPRYSHATGLSPDGYLGRWLLITAVLFTASGLLYAFRVRRLLLAAARRAGAQAD